MPKELNKQKFPALRTHEEEKVIHAQMDLFQTVLLREVIQLQTGKLKIVTLPFDDIVFYTDKKCNTQKLCPERSSETAVLEELI